MKVKIEETAVHIVNYLQVSISYITKFIGREQSIMKEIVNELTLDAIGQQATAILIGLNYHSRCHIGVSMFYTLYCSKIYMC